MRGFVVVVREHGRYVEGSPGQEHGRFDTFEEAEAACRRIVDASLEAHHRPGISADALFRHYTLWGDDPGVVCPPEAHARSFSSWTYAETRCRDLCRE